MEGTKHVYRLTKDLEAQLRNVFQKVHLSLGRMMLNKLNKGNLKNLLSIIFVPLGCMTVSADKFRKAELPGARSLTSFYAK